MKKIQNFTDKKKGFSLLEMVIIVAIIAIMTSVMMVITFRERDAKKIESVGREVTAAIREAQNYALTGKQQGTGLPCSFGFFIPDFTDPTSGGTQIEVRGSYRLVDGMCGDETMRGAYTATETGRLFSEKDLSEEDIEIFGFTSNQHGPSGDQHPTSFVAFGVPYGDYFDAESNLAVDPSIGVEFVIRKAGDEDEEYHICVHDTGLIEEKGFVKRTSGQAGADVGEVLACTF